MDNSVLPTPTVPPADFYESPAIVDLGTLEELTNGVLGLNGPDVNVMFIGPQGGDTS